MSNVAEIFDTMSYGPAPEADTAARAWLAAHSARFGLFINGAWVQPADEGAFFESRNPATGEILARIAVAGPKEVDAAVAAAATAASTSFGPATAIRAKVSPVAGLRLSRKASPSCGGTQAPLM